MMPSCIGTHRAGDGSFHIYDINQVPCKRVCHVCLPFVNSNNRYNRGWEHEQAEAFKRNAHLLMLNSFYNIREELNA